MTIPFSVSEMVCSCIWTCVIRRGSVRLYKNWTVFQAIQSTGYGIYLLTYTCSVPERKSLRSLLWDYRGQRLQSFTDLGHWVIYYSCLLNHPQCHKSLQIFRSILEPTGRPENIITMPPDNFESLWTYVRKVQAKLGSVCILQIN